jgi:hypothetical protein
LFVVISVGRRYEYFETNEDCGITRLQDWRIAGLAWEQHQSFERKRCLRFDKYREKLYSTSFSARKPLTPFFIDFFSTKG